jgi:hypothetical protein
MPSREMMKDWFHLIDANHSGEVSMTEFFGFSLREALKAADSEAPNLLAFLSIWDTNKDDELDIVELEKVTTALGFAAITKELSEKLNLGTALLSGVTVFSGLSAEYQRCAEKAAEDEFERQMAKWFRAIRPMIVAGVTAESFRFSWDDPEVQSLFGQAVNEVTAKTFASGYNTALGGLAARGVEMPAMTPTNLDARIYLLEYRNRLYASTSESLGRAINTELAAGIARSETLPELTDRISTFYDADSQTRAATTARTETARAFNRGREDAWRESGIVSGKRWQLSGNPCPVCVTLSERYARAAIGDPFVKKGQTIKLVDGSDYTPTYDNVEGADAHPNCSCTIVAEFKS